jgi:hypothetical protein
MTVHLWYHGDTKEKNMDRRYRYSVIEQIPASNSLAGFVWITIAGETWDEVAITVFLRAIMNAGGDGAADNLLVKGYDTKDIDYYGIPTCIAEMQVQDWFAWQDSKQVDVD